MALVAFMQRNDPNRISSITAHVDNKSLRRKLVPTRKSTEDTDVCTKLVVADCQTHIGGVSVPVELRAYREGLGFIKLGTARCCPLCWRVVVGVDGTSEPKVKPLNHLGPTKKSKPPRPTKKARPVVQVVGEKLDPKLLAIPQIKEWKGLEWFTTQEVMAQFNLSRPAAAVQMGQLFKFGLVERIVGGGRGNSTQYRVITKK